jgi:hypothetical protein
MGGFSGFEDQSKIEKERFLIERALFIINKK